MGGDGSVRGKREREREKGEWRGEGAVLQGRAKM
jgi:hypothetical protein